MTYCYSDFHSDLKVGEVGTNAVVLIPMVDRGKGDPRKIIAIIVDSDLHYM